MTLKTSTNSPDDPLAREISPFDAEAEPDDLAAMEPALSETTEEGCCDMPPDEYDEDEAARLANEINDLVLAEPEPPEFNQITKKEPTP